MDAQSECSGPGHQETRLSLVEGDGNAVASIKNPELRTIFERILARTGSEQQIKEDLKTDIPVAVRQEPALTRLPVCPMPTDLCRISPFFPMNRHHLKERSFIEEMILMKSAWGEIQFYGPKLSTYEEDVLMAILALLDMTGRREGTGAYTYKGSFYPLLKLLKGPKPSKSEYRRVYRALKLLSVSGFNLVIFRDNKAHTERLSNIVTYAEWNHETRELTITLNPYFHAIYVNRNFTLIDIEQRMRLTSPVAKALHRFILSHRNNVWQGHFLTLAASLNLNLEQPPFHIRESLRDAMAQLIKEGILSGESRFVSRDIIRIDRTAVAKERKRMVKT